MGKFVDLTGQKFGKLTVIKRNGKDIHGNILWFCDCDCGNTNIVRTKELKGLHIKSCGCALKDYIEEKVKYNKIHNLCSVDGCSDKHYGRGYCNKHLKEINQYGKIRSEYERKLARKRPKEKQNKVCEVECCNSIGFNNKEFRITLCQKHASQYKKYGKPLKRTRSDKNIVNIYRGYAEIILEDKQGKENGIALIDLEFIGIAKKYKWHNSNGYVISASKVEGKRIRLHRLVINAKEDEIVDHINRNPLDCRLLNLRLCTKTENNRNVAVRPTSKTGIRGVEKLYNKFYAYINVDKKKIHLGGFKNIEDANRIRKEAEIKYFGDFAPKDYDENGVEICYE